MTSDSLSSSLDNSLNNDLGDKFSYHLSAIACDIEPNVSMTLWQNIAQHYDEPIRAYHNLTHLQQLFEQFDHIEAHLKHASIVAIALFYHDVIYDPKCSNNERKSAEYAVADLQRYLTYEQCLRIYALIMMTATHNIDDKEDSDAAYLLDIDLSILGADWTHYERYIQAIRQEYIHVAIDDYRRGRIAVLNDLLAHNRLYSTDYYERLERQARANIEREIKFLSVS